jgi:hypothetical protein
MTDPARPDLVSRPTPDQIERFSKLTAEQRFQWLVDTLALCFELATPRHAQRGASTRPAKNHDVRLN